MKVAVISDSLPGYHRLWSGAEIIAETLAEMLDGNGCMAFCVTGPFDKKPAKGGIEVLEVKTPLKRFGAISRNFPVDIGAIRGVYRVLKMKRPDIVHINAKYLFLPAVVASWRLGIPVVFTVPDYFIFCPTTFIRRPDGRSCESYHGKDCHNCLTLLGEGFLKKMVSAVPAVFTRSLLALRAKGFDYILRKLPAYVVLSESSKERLVRYGIPEEKVRLIYHYRLAAPEETKEEITNPSAVFVGWLTEENGVDVLVRAFIKAQKELPEARLYLIGTGKEGFIKGLKREVAEAGINGKVVFLGKKENSEALSIISKCDVTVAPHQWPKEFGPVILIEALAMGKPVIASRIGATDEFVSDGENGFLVDDYRSPAAFAEKLALLLSDRRLAREMGGRHKGRTGFVRDDSSSRKMKELYRSLLARHVKAG